LGIGVHQGVASAVDGFTSQRIGCGCGTNGQIGFDELAECIARPASAMSLDQQVGVFKYGL
jgi:hypothetical protein